MKIKVKVREKKQIDKKISTEFIRLDEFLKLNDAVQSGGHAKVVVQGGEVKVNGEICTMRGKKLRPGDSAEYNGIIYNVI